MKRLEVVEDQAEVFSVYSNSMTVDAFVERVQEYRNDLFKKGCHKILLTMCNDDESGFSECGLMMIGYRYENDKEFNKRCAKIKKQKEKEKAEQKEIEKEEYEEYLKLKKKYEK